MDEMQNGGKVAQDNARLLGDLLNEALKYINIIIKIYFR